MVNQDILEEFNKQLKNLIQKGYHTAANLDEETFLKKFMHLKEKLISLPLPNLDIEKGTLPFVVVVKNSLISSEKMMGMVQKNDKTGVTILRPLISQDFMTIPDLNIPKSDIYILVDIDRGKENINIPPVDAISLIAGKKRLPLTIDEGIAVVTHYPEFLLKNNCFSLLGSRTGKDKRVPAIWINSNKEANLGWCWDGNPHTWLGSASCLTRIG